jgi:hypothetical protein
MLMNSSYTPNRYTHTHTHTHTNTNASLLLNLHTPLSLLPSLFLFSYTLNSAPDSLDYPAPYAPMLRENSRLCSREFLEAPVAPVVTCPAPKTSSSATRPPQADAMKVLNPLILYDTHLLNPLTLCDWKASQANGRTGTAQVYMYVCMYVCMYKNPLLLSFNLILLCHIPLSYCLLISFSE